MPASLDSLFYMVVDTTSSPIGVEGGWWWGATKWPAFLIQKIIWPNDINSGCFQFHISQNLATSMPNLTSQSCGDSLLAVYLAGQAGAIY